MQDYLIIIEKSGAKLHKHSVSECSDSGDRFEKFIKKVKIINLFNETVKKSIKSDFTVQSKSKVICLVECLAYLWTTRLTWKN